MYLILEEHPAGRSVSGVLFLLRENPLLSCVVGHLCYTFCGPKNTVEVDERSAKVSYE